LGFLLGRKLAEGRVNRNVFGGVRGRERKMILDELSSAEMTPVEEIGGEGRDLGLGSAIGLRGAVSIGGGGGGIGSLDVDELVVREGERRGEVEDQGIRQGEDEDVMGDGEKHGTGENGDGGDGGSEEEIALSDAVKDRSDLEREENELPVLRDTGDVDAEQDCLAEKKLLRSEIPDSEADTDEAISPVKGTVESKIQHPEMDEGDDGQDIPSMGDTPEDLDGEQNVETAATTSSLKVEHSTVASNDETTQRPETEALPAHSVHQDSSAVSFVDDEALIILPHFTTSDLQPTHTPTKTRTQEEEIVNLHFADAVAVMSDVGGGTQDVMSSLEEATLQGGEIDMELSGKEGCEVPPTGEIEIVHEAVTMAEAVTEDGFLVSQPREVIPSETANVHVEPISLPIQTVLEDSRVSEPHLAAQKEGNFPDSTKDEDVMMSDDLSEIQQSAAKEPIDPAREAGLAGVEETRIIAPIVSASTTTTARSIPDSDDDEEELPDADPISKSEENVGSKLRAPVVSTPTTNELAVEAQIFEPSSSLETTHISKPHLPPKTLMTSFKAPILSTAISPTFTESTTSASKPRDTISRPSKGGDGKEKTTSKTFPASETSQNKDVLMAELKAIKIVSCGLSDDGCDIERITGFDTSP